MNYHQIVNSAAQGAAVGFGVALSVDYDAFKTTPDILKTFDLSLALRRWAIGTIVGAFGGAAKAAGIFLT